MISCSRAPDGDATPETPLAAIGILEYLSDDPRPILVLDSRAQGIAFRNAALQRLAESCPTDLSHLSSSSFHAWLLDFVSTSSDSRFSLSGQLWRTSWIGKRWIVLTAQDHAEERGLAPVTLQPEALSAQARRDDHIEHNEDKHEDPSSSLGPRIMPTAPLDWTRYDVPGLSAHTSYIKSFPWETTATGPIKSWPDILRSVVLTMNANSDPRILLWGPERVMIYNESCAPFLGQKHPAALGGRAADIWDEVWPAVADFVVKAETEGKANKIANVPLAFLRHGYDEETFWICNFVPIVGPGGQTVAVLDEFMETTSQVIQDRRRDIVLRTSEMASRTNTLAELWDRFLEGIQRAEDDIPYAAIYVPSEDAHAVLPDVGSPVAVARRFSIHGVVGLDVASGVLPQFIDLADGPGMEHAGVAAACQKARDTGEMVRMTSADGSLPPRMSTGVPGRCAACQIDNVYLVPIADVLGDRQLAFALVAVTSRRPLDSNLTGFVNSLTDVLARYAATIFLPDERRRARQRYEELETSFRQRLEASSLQVEKVEAGYEKLINQVPVGIFVIAPAGNLIYHNDAYLTLTGATAEFVRDVDRQAALVSAEDREYVENVWKGCLESKQSVTVEYRVSKEWRSVDPITGKEIRDETWILASVVPELDDNGTVERVTGWMLDISDRKYHEKLNMRRVEGEVAERRFSRLAKQAPMGMYLLKPDGAPMYLNDAYYDIIGLTREQFADTATRTVGWADQILEEDREMVNDAWIKLAEQGIPLSIEYRVKKPWTTYDSATGTVITGPTWLQGTAFAERDETGKILAVQGFVHEISLKKFSERLLAERLEEALETKRQADRFIDMTSHEMRNPLSAILQSADSILTALESSTTNGVHPHPSPGIPATASETVIDAAQTIILCGQHQKRIVDDILTLSKLDSNLLVISPDKTHVPSLIARCFKMYEGELDRADIEAVLQIEQGYKDLQIHNVMLDSSRVLQVVINLFTNAVKFTQHAAKRRITVFVNAAKRPPTDWGINTRFIPPRANRPDTTTAQEWGDGEEVYLQIAVQDTGKGLDEEELKLMFQRFSQASPKTYKQYGGSGLGLFISRELTELQGGQIGVESTPGVGTTFTFYVKARRVVRDNAQVMADDSSGGQATLTGSLTVRPARRQASIVYMPPPTPPSEAVTDAKMHVLVVEDNEINQRVMAAQLRRIGCSVQIAGNGLEALAFLSRTSLWHRPPPDALPLSVVLMDLEMPVLGGLETIKRIRSLQDTGELTRHVPVIAVTANARSEQIAHAIKEGMDSVVTKPFRIPELVPKMEGLVKSLAQREDKLATVNEETIAFRDTGLA